METIVPHITSISMFDVASKLPLIIKKLRLASLIYVLSRYGNMGG
jgi:hypothetical protein